MADLEEAKVVRVLNDYEVVVNVGRASGVTNGAKVLIYTLGDMVTDPDTGEALEEIEIIRGRGKVTNVQEKICTVRSTAVTQPVTTIRRTTTPFNFPLGGQTTEESRSPEPAPFEGPQVGDRARFT